MSLVLTKSQGEADRGGPLPSRLTEADAIDIWIARWLRVARKEIRARYACDPRRIYEIWEGQRFPAAREKAEARFRDAYPGLVDRTDFSLHRRFPRAAAAEGQLNLF
ncbi:MAG: hypothetical protein R3D33_02570 [Hyphomicrobiaceae bacterium]